MTPEFHAPRNPRTRRQLREALQSAKNRATALEQAIEAAGLEVRTATTAYSNGFTFFDAEIVDAISLKEHSRRVEAGIIEARADARRETLEKVIEALELTEYGYYKPGSYPHVHIYVRPGHERFWDDINVALEHRETEKHAETVRKTAERVAGLTKKAEPARFFVFNHDDSYGSTQTISEGDIQVTARQSGKSTTPKKKPAKKEEK